MISIIKNLFRSLALYLELRVEGFYKSLIQEHQQTRTNLINEIEKLRDSGDGNDAFRADLLRAELKTEDQRFESISTTYIKAKGGEKD